MAKYLHSKVTGQPYRLDGKGVKIDRSGVNRLFGSAPKNAARLNGGTYHKPASKGSGSGRGNPNHGPDGRFD